MTTRIGVVRTGFTTSLHVDALAAVGVADPREHEAGVVRTGFRAGLTVPAADPVDVPASELPAVPVVHTVVDGDLYRW